MNTIVCFTNLSIYRTFTLILCWFNMHTGGNS
jgi:hypothetical protein